MGILPFVWSRDGRLIFGRREEGRNRQTSNLWSIQTDVQRGQRQGNPVRVTRLAGVNFRDLSITADGSMLSALLVRNQADVYLGELASDAGGLESVRQLTVDERQDYPSGWTPDSAGLLLWSSRLGSNGVFKWSRDTESLQLVSERGNKAVSTTDGSWILLRREGGIEALPAAGGPARRLADRARSLACSRALEPACVFGLPDGKEYAFNSLNPRSGEVEELIRIRHRSPFTNWSLAPDSRRVAVVHGDDNVVRIIDLKDGGEIALEVEGWSDFEFVAWSADGESLFLNSGLSFAGDFAVLLQVGMDGRAQVLRDAPNVWHVYPVPSPDGRYLAFAGMPFHGNIWLIRDF